MDAERLGQLHRGRGVADPVDVVEREPGVLEGGGNHRHLEVAAGALELDGRRGVVGHADDGCSAPQRVGHAPARRRSADTAS
jgi:hypothetical protein